MVIVLVMKGVLDELDCYILLKHIKIARNLTCTKLWNYPLAQHPTDNSKATLFRYIFLNLLNLFSIFSNIFGFFYVSLEDFLSHLFETIKSLRYVNHDHSLNFWQ